MDLAADLPAPRDDEPADLRRDILDELADHLNCAVDRERQRAVLNGDEAAAQNQDHLWPRVVARFGHPARIARQLWWDAMKEKIMSQRTQTATLVVMSLFCVAMMIVTFMSLADSRQLARDNQNLNKQLLAQLEDLASRPSPAPAAVLPATNNPAEWNQLQVKCVWGSEDGEPAEGVRVYLSSNSENTSGIPSGEETTGADGIVDFGKVLYGTYIIMVTLPNHLISQEYVAVRPGQDKTVTVVCPEGDGLGTVSLKPQFDWDSVPEALRGRVWVLCSIRVDSGSGGSGSGLGTWDTQYEYEWPAELQANGNAFELESGFDHNYDVANYLINETGQILAAHPLEVDGEELESAELTGSQLRRVAFRMFELPEQPEYIDSVELPAGGYYVNSLVLIADPADASGRRLLAIENLLADRESMAMQYFGSGGPMGSRSGGPMGSFDFQSRGGGMSRGGRGGQGWGGGREPDTTAALQTQLGPLPFSYLQPVISDSTMASMYGGIVGTSEQTQFIVRWNTEAAWDFPVYVPETLFLADLALRVPVGMDISAVPAHVTADEAESIGPDTVVDLIWKGLVVDAEGNVIPEEHVLLTGLDVVATGERADQDTLILKVFYLPITPDEAGYLVDTAIGLGLWLRPSAGPARESVGTPMDRALLERLRSDSLQVGASPVEYPMGLRRVWLDVPKVDSIQFQNGPYCNIVLYTDQVPGIDEFPAELLRNKLVHGALDPSSLIAADYQVAVIVTAEEEEVIERARNFGMLVAMPSNSPGDISLFESNPNLDEVLRELEALTTAAEAPDDAASDGEADAFDDPAEPVE